MDSGRRGRLSLTRDVIRLIDISGLGGSDVDRRRVADEMGRACRETGFFYVSNHGVSEALGDGVIAMARQFFALPQEVKSVGFAVNSRCRHGYEPMQEQTLASDKPREIASACRMR